MQPKQNQNRYGNFVKPKRNLSLVKVGGILAVVLAVFVTAFVLHSKDKKTISGSQVIAPTVYASELPSWWLKDNFGTSVCDKDECKSDADPDNDKLTNSQEYYYHSNPKLQDTNKNGLTDGEDVAQGYDPSKTGKVTFEEAANDDSILGEGLVFNKDIKQMFAEEVSPDKVVLPEPDSSLIKISNDNSSNAIKNYLKTTYDLTESSLPADFSTYVQNASNTQNPDMLAKVQDTSDKIIQKLANVDVPSSAIQLHKYLITYFQLLPKVITIPDQAQIENLTDPQANSWYDDTQAFLVLNQKIDTEQQKLSKL